MVQLRGVGGEWGRGHFPASSQCVRLALPCLASEISGVVTRLFRRRSRLLHPLYDGSPIRLTL